MYNPAQFVMHDAQEMQRLIVEHPFGTLVTNSKGLDANHLPFELQVDEHGKAMLLAHVARASPLWQEAKDGDEVLVIFRAGDAYVSPNWYPSKHEKHEQVPTWVYQVVHVHGKIKIRDDEKFLRGLVGRLTRTHEQRAQEARPWKMSDSEPEFIARVIAMIVGIEIEVTSMQGKSKLGQNKEVRDRVSAADQLLGKGNTELGAAMRDAEKFQT